MSKMAYCCVWLRRPEHPTLNLWNSWSPRHEATYDEYSERRGRLIQGLIGLKGPSSDDDIASQGQAPLSSGQRYF